MADGEWVRVARVLDVSIARHALGTRAAREGATTEDDAREANGRGYHAARVPGARRRRATTTRDDDATVMRMGD